MALPVRRDGVAARHARAAPPVERRRAGRLRRGLHPRARERVRLQGLLREDDDAVHPPPDPAGGVAGARRTRTPARTCSVDLVFSKGGDRLRPHHREVEDRQGRAQGHRLLQLVRHRAREELLLRVRTATTFGGATLAIKGGSTSPVLVAGTNGGTPQCRVCHSVSADGSTLVTQHGDNYAAVEQVRSRRTATPRPPMSPADDALRVPGALAGRHVPLLATRRRCPASAAPRRARSSRCPRGAPIATTGSAGGPARRHAGLLARRQARRVQLLRRRERRREVARRHGLRAQHVHDARRARHAERLASGSVPVVLADERRRRLRARDGDQRRARRDAQRLARRALVGDDRRTPTARRASTSSTASATCRPAPTNHAADATLNYEPTVNPVPSGGYAWVVFTSRRMYGNVATIDPFWSDPRDHDISATPTTKKLWVAAIDLNAPPGTDPEPPGVLPARAGAPRGQLARLLGRRPVQGRRQRAARPATSAAAATAARPTAASSASRRRAAARTSSKSARPTADCCGGLDLSCINGRCAQKNPN